MINSSPRHTCVAVLPSDWPESGSVPMTPSSPIAAPPDMPVALCRSVRGQGRCRTARPVGRVFACLAAQATIGTMSREGRELQEALQREMPSYISAAVRYQIAIANQLEIAVTDIHAIGALLEFGPIGAGRLAELMGMTTGATTRLVDRLERGGYVTRQPDPEDRRRVVLQLVEHRVADIGRYYEPMAERWQQQVAGYSDDQMRFLVEFLRTGREHAIAETVALRAAGRAHGSRHRDRAQASGQP
jgi:DNA-binding MarR family transcriptional regulator